jgi:hypothetical protein
VFAHAADVRPRARAPPRARPCVLRVEAARLSVRRPRAAAIPQGALPRRARSPPTRTPRRPARARATGNDRASTRPTSHFLRAARPLPREAAVRIAPRRVSRRRARARNPRCRYGSGCRMRGPCAGATRRAGAPSRRCGSTAGPRLHRSGSRPSASSQDRSPARPRADAALLAAPPARSDRPRVQRGLGHGLPCASLPNGLSLVRHPERKPGETEMTPTCSTLAACPMPLSRMCRRTGTTTSGSAPTLAGARANRSAFGDRETQARVRRGTLRAPAHATVNEAAEELVAGMRAGRVRTRSGDPYKPSAIRSYESALRDHVVPRIGRARLATCSTATSSGSPTTCSPKAATRPPSGRRSRRSA